MRNSLEPELDELRDCRINDNFCALLESGPKPTVAAVESLALGGGLEVALACNARLCTPGGALSHLS